MTEKANQDGYGLSNAPSYYEHCWPFTFLLDGAQNLDAMILALQSRLDTLREMRAADVELSEVVHAVGGCDLFPEFDHVVLTTTDPAVAKRFGFEPANDADAGDDEIDESSTESDVPSFDDYAMKRIIIPWFVWGDGELRPFDGFCRGDGAILPDIPLWQETIGVFTAEGMYFTLVIDTRVRCAVPQFWIEKETFHFPIVAFTTMFALVDPKTGNLMTHSQPAQASGADEQDPSTGSVDPDQAAEPQQADQQ